MKCSILLLKIKFLGRPVEEASWEPEDTIPPLLLECFNSPGNDLDIIVKQSMSNSQISETFTLKKKDVGEIGAPVSKKAKRFTELPHEG